MFNLKRPLLVLATALALVALIAAGCGGDDEASGEQDAEFNGTDVAFAAQMMPHHEHAIEMAELAVEKSPNAQVKDLAQGILDTQERELEQLQSFLDTFGAEPATPAPPVMERNEAIIAELEQASGEQFDKIFLDEMRGHHASAVEMADIELEGGEFAEAQTLAEEIKAAQLEEISEMNTLSGTVSATG